MVQLQAARWVKNDYAQQSSVTQILIDLKWQDLPPEVNRCETLTDVQNSPHHLILIEPIKYVKLQRNLINL